MDFPSGWQQDTPGPEQLETKAPRQSTKPRKSKHVAAPVSSVAPSFPVTGGHVPQGVPPPAYQEPYYPMGVPPGGPYAPAGQPYAAAGPYSPPQYMTPGGMPQPGMMPGYPANMPAYFADPLANVALAYGQTLAGQGKDIVNQNLEKWFSISTLKFYFAVDTKYVLRKLFVLFCPFFVRDWSLKSSPTQCVAPKEDPNAPDLYIPSMAFITYVFATGILLGIQHRFDPEHLYDQASLCALWTSFEIVCVLLTFYIAGISSNLRFLHLLAFTGYKYVGMVACVVAAIFGGKTGYYIALLYFFTAIVWLFLRSLNVYLQPAVTGPDNTGRKRRILALVGLIILQLFTMFVMTRRICLYDVPSNPKIPVPGAEY